MVTEDNVHIIIENLGEVLDSEEFIEHGKLYDERIILLVESITDFLQKYSDASNLLDSFIVFRKLFVEFESLMHYQYNISRLINKRGLEIDKIKK